MIQERLNQLDEARINCDVRRMLFLVRTSLTRNLGNMGNLKLYKHSHVGTKDLVERYIESAQNTLKTLLDLSERSTLDGFGPRYMMDQVLLARQAFGRSALLLSGGATFGMCHSGVLRALWERKLLPRIISGASAGSIICSVLCTRTDEEVPELMATFCHGDLAVFEEEGNEDSVLTKAARFLKYGSLFDISHLTRVMRDLLGDMTFQEAYNRTRRILNICVSSAGLYELPRLLNYITAPNVLIWSAVAASCSVPLVFTAASILAKDTRTGKIHPWNSSPQKWIDGSVDNDLPMTRLSEMFNVNHFIVSQVNPHVVPFIKEGTTDFPEPPETAHGHTDASSWLYTVTNLAKSEAVHRMHTLIDLGIFPTTLTKTVSILNQKYSGDITILPEISFSDMPRILSNPSVEFMENAMLAGERATWPKLSRIQNHLAIELALDNAAQKLRERVVFSSSQADLRLGPCSKTKVDGKSRKPIAKGPGQRQRKWSQSSEPDAATANSVKHGRADPSGRNSHHKTRSLLSPSQYEIDKILSGRPTKQNTLFTKVSSTLPDLVSSGAETSNNYTSDSYADHSSSSIESPTSPVSQASPEVPRSSQSVPATPAAYCRQSSHLGLPNMKAPATSADKPLPQDLPRSTTKPSSPETTYKQLFHGSKARVASIPMAMTPNIDQPSSKPTKKINALGLNIDISGTRSMMPRRKKN